jgi:iron complex transport system ATP-binding protein
MLRVESLACGYGGRAVVHDVSFALGAGEAMCLLGANGSGKTTLFKAILRFLPLMRGQVTIDGEDVACWPQRKLARAIAYVPQAHIPPFAFKVRDVVLMARTAYMSATGAARARDYEVVEESLAALGVERLADKDYTELSGGERQMVLVARALAQEARLLVMDEPASNLDFGNQIRLLREVKLLARRGISVLITTHSPNHAFQCASQVAVMKTGRLLACGGVDEVMTGGVLEEAYGVPLQVAELDGGDRICYPTSAMGG